MVNFPQLIKAYADIINRRNGMDLGKTKKGYALNPAYAKEVWNAAIEEAAKIARENGEGCCHEVWEEIRKLKQQ